jgi:hypothetical protein
LTELPLAYSLPTARRSGTNENTLFLSRNHAGKNSLDRATEGGRIRPLTDGRMTSTAP